MSRGGELQLQTGAGPSIDGALLGIGEVVTRPLGSSDQGGWGELQLASTARFAKAAETKSRAVSEAIKHVAGSNTGKRACLEFVSDKVA